LLIYTEVRTVMRGCQVLCVQAGALFQELRWLHIQGGRSDMKAVKKENQERA
jgi:hypothetical protein